MESCIWRKLLCVSLILISVFGKWGVEKIKCLYNIPLQPVEKKTENKANIFSPLDMLSLALLFFLLEYNFLDAAFELDDAT